DEGASLETATQAGLEEAIGKYGKFVSGFGHRFHPVDPRAPRLLELVDEAASNGTVSGRFAVIGRAVERELSIRKDGRKIPMNIDGATAVIYAELGFPAPRWPGAYSACLVRLVSWRTRGNRPSRVGGTRAQFRVSTFGTTTVPTHDRFPHGEIARLYF